MERTSLALSFRKSSFHDVHLSCANVRTHVSRAAPFRSIALCSAKFVIVSRYGQSPRSSSPLGSWLMDSPLRSADKAPLFGFIARHWRDAGSRNAEGRLRFPSAAFRDVELNALNYRRSSTSRVAFGLTPRSLLKMEWALVGRGDR